MTHEPFFERPDDANVPEVLPVDDTVVDDAIGDNARIPEVAPAEPPAPSFWMAALWCLAYVSITQTVATVVAVGILLYQFMRRAPVGPPPLADVKAFLKSPEFANAMIPAMLLGQLVGILFSWLLIRLFVGKPWPRILAVRLPSLSHAALALLGLPGLIIIASGLDTIAKRFLPSLIDLDEAMLGFANWPWPIGVLVIGLGPGIGEELWCRGFLGRGLVARHGVVVGVLLTSLLFGLIHLEPRQVVYATGVGMLLHSSYLLTRSLWVPVMLHTVNNSFAVLAAQIPALADFDVPGEQVPLSVYAAGIVIVLAVGWALYHSRPRLVSEASVYPWRPAFPSVEWPPPRSGAQVVYPHPSLAAWAAATGSLALLLAAMYLAI